jgi:hypothetical protein
MASAKIGNNAASRPEAGGRVRVTGRVLAAGEGGEDGAGDQRR